MTSPRRSASAASNLRADSSRSIAWAGPTSRGRIQLTPHSAIRPRRENAVVKVARSDANRMSQNSEIGTAIPAQGPLIAAMIGLGIESR